MELYTGIDIVDINRFGRAIERYGERFLKRVFTEKELAAIPSKEKNLHLSISFSFKESIWKALPEALQKDFYFRDIEVLWKRRKPLAALKGKTDRTALNLHFFITGRCVVTTAVFLK